MVQVAHEGVLPVPCRAEEVLSPLCIRSWWAFMPFIFWKCLAYRIQAQRQQAWQLLWRDARIDGAGSLTRSDELERNLQQPPNNRNLVRQCRYNQDISNRRQRAAGVLDGVLIHLAGESFLPRSSSKWVQRSYLCLPTWPWQYYQPGGSWHVLLASCKHLQCFAGPGVRDFLQASRKTVLLACFQCGHKAGIGSQAQALHSMQGSEGDCQQCPRDSPL